MPHNLPSISMTIPALNGERAISPLPSIAHDISRPPSASTTSDRRNSHHGSEQGERVTLPALSTLANVASQGNAQQSQSSSNTQPPSYSNASPTPTSVAGQGNIPPVCQNCQTSTTPLWRRDESGSVLCNACGLFLKLHGRPRPISLKTDVIKSRNRVKSSAHSGRRKMQFSQGPHGPLQHPDLATPPPHPSYRRVSDHHMGGYSDRSASPISRAGTPASLHPHHTYPGHHHPHTAPPLTHHLFDPNHARSPSPMPPQPPPYHSAPNTIAHRGTSPLPLGPTLPLPIPTVTNRTHSPSLAPTHPSGPSVPELQTRVSELEVINALYKSKVHELEGLRERDLATIHHLQRENEELRHREARPERQPLSERPPEYPRQAPPEPPSEPIIYAEMTGSMKRRRGRTLERAAEESRLYGSKRRETGEFPQPGPPPVHA